LGGKREGVINRKKEKAETVSEGQTRITKRKKKRFKKKKKGGVHLVGKRKPGRAQLRPQAKVGARSGKGDQKREGVEREGYEVLFTSKKTLILIKSQELLEKDGRKLRRESS